jgi:hypothetical protein
MKVIVFAVIGLLLGLGGGSGVAIVKAKKTMAAAADSMAKKDSALVLAKAAGEGAKAGEGAEGTPTAAPVLDSATRAAHAPAVTRDSLTMMPNGEHAAGAGGGPTPAALPSPAAAGASKAAAGDTSRTATAAAGRIAKIFAAMSAKDAARVLLQLDDADIQTVLAGLNDKQAAAILAGFPPERAAAISRAAIRGKKGAS